MNDLFDRVRGDLDFGDLAVYLEDHCDDTAKGHMYARLVRDLRDRIVRGVPVHASELDIESFLAVDLLKQIRDITLCPDEKPLIWHIERMVEYLRMNNSPFTKKESEHDRTNHKR